MYVHALHTVHALPDLRVAGGRLGDGPLRLFRVLGHAISGIVNLTKKETELGHSNKMNPTFVNWSIDDRLESNYFLPYDESRFHHFPITTSFVQVSAPLGRVR
jgi:hypothetical protein